MFFLWILVLVVRKLGKTTGIKVQTRILVGRKTREGGTGYLLDRWDSVHSSFPGTRNIIQHLFCRSLPYFGSFLNFYFLVPKVGIYLPLFNI